MRHLCNVYVCCVVSYLFLAASPVAAIRLPGGPHGAKALAADCYGGIEIVDLTGDDVTLSKHGVPTVRCMDGTACDRGDARDDSCTFRVALCANQGNVDGCTAPSSLRSFRATGKIKGLKHPKGRLTFDAGPLTEGCGAATDIVIPVKAGKDGSRVARSAVLKLVAKAPTGVRPRTDKDTILLSCEPIPPGVCVDAAMCADGNRCTADVCTNGVCSNPGNVDCSTPPDACSLAGTCDPATGECVHPPAEDGTSCGECSTCAGGICQPKDDGIACSTGVCAGGACRCGQDPDCAASETACARGVCVDGSCNAMPVSAGEPCVGQDGVCTADGACVLQCQGDDTSACSSNKCETYTCDHGRCVFDGLVVCPLPPEVPDCYGPAACNTDTGTCDRTYLGDDHACGPEDAGNRSLCCGGECVPSDAQNCGACGNACVAPDPACVEDSCTCTASLLTDDDNCGSCGNACVNAACFQGNCFDGCVIDGNRYVDGEPDPANQCRTCKTAVSRTSWTPLHSDLGTIHFCNKGGCVQSQCYKGQCGCGTDPTCAVLVPENSTAGCVSTPCADAVCENNACVYHPKADNLACNAAFDPRSRIQRGYGSSTCVSQFGTCQSGICVGGAANDGGFCFVQDYADPEICSEPVGTCFGGECVSDRHLPCRTVPAYCNQTVDVTCAPNPDCGPGSPNPVPPEQCNPITTCDWTAPPPSGTIECGTSIDPQPEKCCAGQFCACPPLSTTTCFALQCWSR